MFTDDSEYGWGENPFMDILTQYSLMNIDFSTPENKEMIYNSILGSLPILGINESDYRFLDFDIIVKNDVTIKIVGNNLVSAMWFIGIFPNNCSYIQTKNKLVFEDEEYYFDYKQKKLKWKKVNKKQ